MSTGESGHDGTVGDDFRLAPAGEGRFTAEGPLTFTTARRACAAGRQTLLNTASRTLEIDLSGVTAADSAGLAVLLDWLAAAKHAERGLRYTHLPAGLHALSRISEVETLLEHGV